MHGVRIFSSRLSGSSGVGVCEQVGFPVPSMPLLLAAGALAGTGTYELLRPLRAAFWRQLRRTRSGITWESDTGIKVLHWLCRISLEPDSCVRRTEGLFEKQGARSLVFAKFLPGLNTVATPLAGIFHMRFRRFLLFDALGSLLWAGTFLTLGYLFSGQIEQIAEHAARLGGWLFVVLDWGSAGYIVYKYVARQKFLRRLARVAHQRGRIEREDGCRRGARHRGPPPFHGF